ncbi:glycerate kinase type-2 family protein [Ancylobacter defluvii]|uniref:Hydroxypyruvate reductase n=1 Tax=Ancylobacter defluvii TaxID=1282440 RepID=A0A9W6JTB9_9HYPH|nr:glycerate kinase [Ancylobacter defluvii]MBS7587546.1 glycerate kinase [Ancylobacter defluvii]GLK82236.1 hydroxypyruvate reductase [Ancylobacter defluvii]
MTDGSARAFLDRLFSAAVAAAHPSTCLPPALPPPPATGRLILLAAGKAAGSMLEVAESYYLDQHGFDPARLKGIGVARHGYGRPTRQLEMVEAGHPVPDAAGLAGAQKALDLAASATEEDLVLVLLSGGASANWIAPAYGVELDDKRALTKALLRSGANITEINTVRKHLSRIKGGRLATLAQPAHVVTLSISDVPGDDPAVIGSGPTVPDPTTLAEARDVLARYRIDPPASVAVALRDTANESPKPGDAAFANAEYYLISRPSDSFVATEQLVRDAGYEPVLLGDNLEGEAREVAAAQAAQAKELKAAGRKAVLMSGGELTVTMRGNGRGGPNQEFALALAVALEGASQIYAVAGDTDGTDGGGGDATDPAGAHVTPDTLARAAAAGLDPAAFLANNDSTSFFEAIGDLLAPGPTCTNVNDFRAVLVDP